MSILQDILDIRFAQQYIKPYVQRIKQDAGLCKRDDVTKRYYDVAKQNNMIENIKFAWLGEAGAKQRIASSTASFWSKLYSLKTTNDAVQATDLNQPYQTGNVAPNERVGLYNPNGSSRYMTHPTISFAANEAWSVTTVLNWNGSLNTHSRYAGDGTTVLGVKNGDNRFAFINSLGTGALFTPNRDNKIIGKTAIITFIANSSGNIKVYINGVFDEEQTIITSANFSSFLRLTSNTEYNGSIKAHIIRSGALTPTQITQEYNFFRALYPEIPTVNIASQEWATDNLRAVCTPQGNVIQEIQDNSNVEKITNAADREFSSDTGFWNKGPNTTISGGTLNLAATPAFATTARFSFLTVGKWYKITYTVSNYVAGGIRVNVATSSQYNSANGTYIEYKQAEQTFLYIQNSTIATLSVDDISVQQVGWSDLTNLYDYVYAQTSGTAAQKELAACKAAAAWCSYNNSADNEAIYGKLYNWYAARLFDLDIAEYNTANPTTPWGFGIPTSTDFTTLQTNLGGSAVAGGKMKKEGLNYWLTPNTGADNSSGFSALPSGYRDPANGVFAAQTIENRSWSSTSINMIIITSTSGALSLTTRSNPTGLSIRLIKR